uniref:Uncharacterized protein n=1 Tax=Anguilla anguilla TaxID=7936 RepID=A0A0E9T1S4_ANGAN
MSIYVLYMESMYCIYLYPVAMDCIGFWHVFYISQENTYTF